jgi:hypothetical protein
MYSQRPHTTMKMNYSIDMDSAIAGSVNSRKLESVG